MIKSKLSEILGKKRMKMSELQELTGLGVNTIRKIYYNTGNNVSYTTLNKICNVLEVSVGELFEHIPD